MVSFPEVIQFFVQICVMFGGIYLCKEFFHSWMTKEVRSITMNTHKFVINKECSRNANFYVLLTVRLGSILVNNKLETQFFFFRIYLFQFSTCFEHTCDHHKKN